MLFNRKVWLFCQAFFIQGKGAKRYIHERSNINFPASVFPNPLWACLVCICYPAWYNTDRIRQRVVVFEGITYRQMTVQTGREV